jgi:hypothetical protein
MMPRSAGILAGLLFVLTASAGASGSDPAVAAAVVPGADFFARIDLAAMRRSGFAEALPEGATGSLPLPFGRWKEVAGRLEGAGIATPDIVEILVSGRSNSVEVAAPGKRDPHRAVPSLMAVTLESPLSTANLEAAVSALWEGRAATLTEVDDSALIELAPEGPRGRPIYAASSRQGTTVFLSTDRASIEGALARERTGAYEKLPEALARVDESLPTDLAARMVLLSPDRFTEKLFAPKAKGVGTRPKTIAESMLEPFRELRSLSLALDLTGEARIALIGELSGDEQAQVARTLLTTMILPNLSKALSARFERLAPVADSLSVDGEGSRARVTLRLSPHDLSLLLSGKAYEEGSKPFAMNTVTGFSLDTVDGAAVEIPRALAPPIAKIECPWCE